MKKIVFEILFVFLNFCSVLFSQNKIDSLIFKKVNNYRKNLGLKELIWDYNCYKASEKHSLYLLEKFKEKYPNYIIGHIEENGLRYPSDRWFSVTMEPYKVIAEVAAAGSINFFENDSDAYNKIAEKIVLGWINSKEHNEILIGDYKYAGVSCLYFITKSCLINHSGFNMCTTMLMVNYQNKK